MTAPERVWGLRPFSLIPARRSGGGWPLGSGLLTGTVGIGTAAPAERPHVTDGLLARLRLERTGGSTVQTDASLTSGSVGTTARAIYGSQSGASGRAPPGRARPALQRSCLGDAGAGVAGFSSAPSGAGARLCGWANLDLNATSSATLTAATGPTLSSNTRTSISSPAATTITGGSWVRSNATSGSAGILVSSRSSRPIPRPSRRATPGRSRPTGASRRRSSPCTARSNSCFACVASPTGGKIRRRRAA